MKQSETDNLVEKSRSIITYLLIALLLCSYPLIAYPLVNDAAVRQDKLFPKPPAIEKDVQFWKQVYTEISTSEGYIHDNADLAVIYEKLKLPKNLSYKARSRYTKKIKTKYKKILDKLALVLRNTQGSQDKASQLSKEEKRVLALWPENVSYKQLIKAKKRLRFQLGQSNKFKAGLIRSGQWKPYIISTLKKMGLPLEIAALPHVESSFNNKAYSKVGAAGMWQFTRSTGRRYMRVDHVMDERLDPFIATLAAARLLKNNYAVTGTWPLAMIAYNHGAAGMRRASRKLGTTDIVPILRKYKSRSFGFASRNFYPSFLAAVELSSQPEKYFKNIQSAPAVDYEFIKLTDFISTDTIIDVLNIDRADLMATNPALRPAVWNGNKYIPTTYQLRIDRASTANLAKAMSAIYNINDDKRFNKQKPDRYHRVRRGQTLSIIAARYDVRMSDLIASNNMRNKHMIKIGQVLILPQKDSKKIVVASKSEKKVKEKNLPKVEPIAVPESGGSTINLEKDNALKLAGELNGDESLEEDTSALLADPSDYSVNENNSIEIQAAETLGHYAEWLKLRTSVLRRLNKMKYGKPVVVGKKIKLNFSKVTPEEFEKQRILYHKTLQEEFFEQNQIIGADKYRLSRGESVWKLTRKKYKIPFWLLRQYNPDLDMNRISANKIISFPKVKRRNI